MKGHIPDVIEEQRLATSAILSACNPTVLQIVHLSKNKEAHNKTQGFRSNSNVVWLPAVKPWSNLLPHLFHTFTRLPSLGTYLIDT
jgi:hypothetical protein